MAATVRQSATATSETATTTIAVPLPTGWQAGDVCYIGLTISVAAGSITTPSGWTAVVAAFSPASSTSSLSAVFRRVLQAGDTGPTITTTAARRAAVAVAVQGADTVTPEDVTPTTDTNSGVTFPNVQAPSITPVSAGTLLLTFHFNRNSTASTTMTFTPPSGMTEVAEAENGSVASSTCGLEVASLALGAAAATGTKVATVAYSSGTTSNPSGAAIAVRSAAGATVGLPDLVMARYGR